MYQSVRVRANGNANVQAKFVHHTQCHLIRSVAPRVTENLQNIVVPYAARCKEAGAVASPSSLQAPPRCECEAPRVVPCNAQNLTTQSSGRVMHDDLPLADCEKRESDRADGFRKAVLSSGLPSSDIPAFDA